MKTFLPAVAAVIGFALASPSAAASQSPAPIVCAAIDTSSISGVDIPRIKDYVQRLLTEARDRRSRGDQGGAAQATECVRAHAGAALVRIILLGRTSNLYQSAASAFGDNLFELSSPLLARDYLSLQLSRAEVLVSHAMPFVAVMDSTTATSDIPSTARAVEFWRNSSNELDRHLRGVEPNAVTELDSIVVGLAEMTLETCGQTVALQESGVESNDLFSLRRHELFNRAALLCEHRRAAMANDAYMPIATRFNRELAGQFPFGNLSSRDASRTTVREFLRDYQLARTRLVNALADRKGEEWVARRAFVSRLDSVAEFLAAPLGVHGAREPLVVSPTFNARPSPTAAQVVRWSLAIGGRTLVFPGGRAGRLSWTPGQPVALELQWASRSNEMPRPGAGYAVDGSVVSFEEGGDWALLRFFKAHEARGDSVSAWEKLLEFVPGKPAVFIRVRTTRVDPRRRESIVVEWPSFPASAP